MWIKKMKSKMWIMTINSNDRLNFIETKRNEIRSCERVRVYSIIKSA